MRRRTCLTAAVLAVLVGGTMAQALDVVASQDAKVYVDPIAGMPNRLALGNKGGDQDENWVGNKGGPDNVGYYAAFKLPALAVGETFSSASIQISLHGNNLYPDTPIPPLPAPSNASLKFMGIFDALGADWSKTNGPARILLQDDFSTPAIGRKISNYPNPGDLATGPGGWDYVTRNSSPTGNAALVDAMNSATPTALDGTAPKSPDRYLYVMLAYDPAAPADSRANYTIASLASTAGPDPTLTYETVGVPEPSMLALAGMGSLGLLRRRRR